MTMSNHFMKKILFLSPLLFAFAFMNQNKKTVVFFGDSITEMGARPGGYITRIDSMCKLENKSGEYDLIGSGIGGNKIYDLYLRMDEDVLAKHPSVVLVYIGVNDVWHKASMGTGTDPDKFERFYQAVINKIKAAGAKVVLCTPAVIGERTDFSNQQDGDLNKYAGIVRSLAAKNNLPLIDLRKKFLDYNLAHNPDNKEAGILTTDRVHLNAAGNQLVADEMWKLIKTL